MTGLECGHLYCTTCWTEYLTVKIMDEGASQSIQCPTGDCQMLVDDATVLRLVKDARVTLKYQHLITNSFVTVRLSCSYRCRFKGFLELAPPPAYVLFAQPSIPPSMQLWQQHK